jgi:DNA repair exonuclease SbcCD ATPase subunit
VTNYRVDRVFAPMPRPRDPSQVASQLLERTSRQTSSPPIAGEADSELSLRRQLSRLQRQLAEAQRELANKDDELAAEAERRLETLRTNEELVEQQRELQGRNDELISYEARTRGVEQRLQDQIAAADELAQLVEKEHARTAAAEARVDELTRAFDETRALWNTERAMLDDRAKTEVAAVEAKRRTAVESSEEALAAATSRLRDAHESEVAELRAAHERSLSTLRGELEPKAVAAHSLAEERERLVNEVARLENEVVRTAAERDEVRMREIAQAADTHATEMDALVRGHVAELARLTHEKDEQIIAAQKEARLAEVKVKTLEDTVEGLRESLKKAQREVAEAKERCTVLEADKHTLEDRLIVVGENADKMLEDQRMLREQIEAAESEVRRTSMDRLRFVAYLEEGLAMLGALPPADPSHDAEITVSSDDPQSPTDS